MYRVFFLLYILFNVVQSDASPIQLHPDNPHYFLYQGKPTVLISSCEHYGAVLNLDFDYEKYLDTLQSEGLNYTRIFSGTYVEIPGSFDIENNTLAPHEGRFLAPWARSNTPGYARGGNKFDLEKWSNEYFTRLKDFLRKAEEREIIVEITLFSSIYTDENWNISALNPQNNINDTDDIQRHFVHTLNNGNLLKYQEVFVRHIVREVNSFDNCFFEVQNEPYADHSYIVHAIIPVDRDAFSTWHRRVEISAKEAVDWLKVITSYIVDEEKKLPQKHLIAQNYCNFFYPLKDVDPNVSILNFHNAWPEAFYLNEGLNRVVGFDESGFSGDGDDTYRLQGWNFVLGGGGLFNHLDYSFSTDREDGTDKYSAPGGGSPALRKQISILKKFLEDFDFIHMAPDFQAVKSAPGAFRRVLSNPGREYAIYLYGGDCRELTLSIPTGTYRGEWIDTKTGNVIKNEYFLHNQPLKQLACPVYQNDVALKIIRSE